MKSIFIIILALSFSAPSSAQLINPSNSLNAALNTTSAILQSFKKDSIPKDSLVGACEFNGGTCNGAEIALFKNDVKTFSATLTSSAEFKIPRLERNESYKFVLTWKKHRLIETRIVEAGELISIKVSKPSPR
jgi:hypothetical protein